MAGCAVEFFDQDMSFEVGLKLAVGDPGDQDFCVKRGQSRQNGEERQSCEHNGARVLVREVYDKEGIRGKVTEKVQGEVGRPVGGVGSRISCLSEAML